MLSLEKWGCCDCTQAVSGAAAAAAAAAACVPKNNPHVTGPARGTLEWGFNPSPSQPTAFLAIGAPKSVVGHSLSPIPV